jgi:antitoxin component YwqK of YwqJK toxin-antitoxin module
MRNGRGKFYYQDGGYYDGQWKNDQMNGYGKLYYDGGALAYEGNWIND